MKAFKTGLTAAILLAVFAMTSMAEQVHMERALRHLREARAALEQAAANKGGHRERAIELVDRAISQVEEGMRFARGHR